MGSLGQQPLKAAIPRLLTIPEGVTDVRMDRRTGNLLIKYDPNTITEAEILDYYHALSHIIRCNFQVLKDAVKHDPVSALDKLEMIVKKALHKSVRLDDKLEIPEDVW